MPVIQVSAFDPASWTAASRQIEAYAERIERAADMIAESLATRGYACAVSIMAGHVFSGETIASLTVEHEGNGKYILYAQSVALLFFEFGAGVQGVGHPWSARMGMGAGTYPGQTHALDPNGWWYPTDDPRLIVRTNEQGQGFGHSYGNPPYMPFYQADQDMRQHILDAAQEVFNRI